MGLQAVDHPYLVVYSKTGRKAPDYDVGLLEGAAGAAAPVQVQEGLGVAESAARAGAAWAGAAGAAAMVEEEDEEAVLCGVCGDAADDPVVSVLLRQGTLHCCSPAHDRVGPIASSLDPTQRGPGGECASEARLRCGSPAHD